MFFRSRWSYVPPRNFPFHPNLIQQLRPMPVGQEFGNVIQDSQKMVFLPEQSHYLGSAVLFPSHLRLPTCKACYPFFPYENYYFIKLTPVISSAFGILNNSKIVGSTSQRDPTLFFITYFFFDMSIKGT